MNAAYIYLQLYRLFDKSVPTTGDCGKLCQKACCRGDDAGMYLFPGEKKIFELINADWATIEPSEFTYSFGGKEKNVPILFCSGKCDRFQRPLACRIFPLTPYLKDGKLEIITDPRAKSVCPLSRSFDISDYEPDFVDNIKKTFRILLTNKEFYAFMQAYSEYIAEYFKFFK